MVAAGGAVGPGGGDSSVYDALLTQFSNPRDGNLQATVEEFLDMCDHGFLMHLSDKVQEAGPESEAGLKLRAVAEEVNLAMQRRLVRADANLRDILQSAPVIKDMEKKLKHYFRVGEVDMAFMVMLSMNLEQAKTAGDAESAVQVLTHLSSVVNELQDQRLEPELRLLRKLMRTTCEGVRESMLREKLIVPGADPFQQPEDNNWGGPEVKPEDLQRSITELLEQINNLDEETDLRDTLLGLREEVKKVTAAVARPGPFKQV